MTRHVVQSDFMLVTGGERKTTVGGLITVSYFIVNLFIIITLLQE